LNDRGFNVLEMTLVSMSYVSKILDLLRELLRFIKYFDILLSYHVLKGFFNKVPTVLGARLVLVLTSP
jgi:hypothetical protein